MPRQQAITPKRHQQKHAISAGGLRLRAHAARARVGLIPVDNAAAEDVGDVLIAKSRSPAEIFGRSTLSGLIEALARPAEATRALPISNGTTRAARRARTLNLDIALLLWAG